MECGDPAPLCSARPGAWLYQKNSLFPFAEPGLGNQSGESSPHSKISPKTRIAVDDRDNPYASSGIGLQRFVAESATRPQLKQRNFGSFTRALISSSLPSLANTQR